MTMTHTIKAYSRTTCEDDDTKMSRYEYNGSFGASEVDIDQALNHNNRNVMLGWSKMMDCFYDVLFIIVESNEVMTFNEYEDAND